MFQWLLVAVLVYVIYYLVNKYEKRLNSLTEMIELNKSEITTNQDLIHENKSKINTHHEKITKNREHIDINQEILAKLKD
ncbi:MAG: hypothetical protein GXP61_02305 [Epsilonproteobacteria bacterium]|nr:hypothetical protein [Campylobacterota bacterium]